MKIPDLYDDRDDNNLYFEGFVGENEFHDGVGGIGGVGDWFEDYPFAQWGQNKGGR